MIYKALFAFLLLSPSNSFIPVPTHSKASKTELSSNGLSVETPLTRREAWESFAATSFTAVTASGLVLPKSAEAVEENLALPKVPSVRLGGGKSSLEVSRTIQGHWQLAGGHGRYREVDAVGNMQAHFDAGITTLDTADIYGPSELIVGKFVQDQPKAIPCTKFCCFRYLEVSHSLSGSQINDDF